MNNAIEIKNVSKVYKLGESQPYITLRDSLSNIFRMQGKKGISENSQDFWSLKNINLSIKPGEILGVIGANGAGKSTLLKVLSRITYPTTGTVKIQGRVGSLLEVGTGFHPELTGRENIFLNGAILGMTRSEIRDKFDEIVEFSEVEKFLDTPVKRYSSGMYVRLAFSVAAHLETEVLLVDEVLAVGDAKFQEKSLKRMSGLSRGGRTVIFVSHNLGTISELCDKVAYIRSGELVGVGEPQKMIDMYVSDNLSQDTLSWNAEPDEEKHIQLLALSTKKKVFDINETISIEVVSETRKQVPGSVVVMQVLRNGIELFRAYDSDSNTGRLHKRRIGKTIDKVTLPKKLFKAGNYQVIVYTAVLHKNWTVDQGGSINFTINEVSEDVSFKAYASYRSGLLRVSPAWEHIGKK